MSGVRSGRATVSGRAGARGGVGSSFGSEREAAGALIVFMRAVWCEWG